MRSLFICCFSNEAGPFGRTVNPPVWPLITSNLSINLGTNFQNRSPKPERADHPDTIPVRVNAPNASFKGVIGGRRVKWAWMQQLTKTERRKTYMI